MFIVLSILEIIVIITSSNSPLVTTLPLSGLQGIEPGTLELWGGTTTHCTTMPANYLHW